MPGSGYYSSNGSGQRPGPGPGPSGPHTNVYYSTPNTGYYSSNGGGYSSTLFGGSTYYSSGPSLCDSCCGPPIRHRHF